MNMFHTAAIAVAVVVAMGAPVLASSSAFNSTAKGANAPGSVELALSLEEMNCASSDASNLIPCETKGRA